MKQAALKHVRLAGDLTGEYVVAEERLDGRILLVPAEPSGTRADVVALGSEAIAEHREALDILAAHDANPGA